MSISNEEPQNSNPPSRRYNLSRIYRWIIIIGRIVAIIAAIVGIITACVKIIENIQKISENIPTPTPLPVLSYSFEDSTMGWQCEQSANDVRACQQVRRSDVQHHDGQFALEMMLNLIPGDPNNSKGEVWVSQTPINQSIANWTITAWIYIPAEAVGNPDDPNGVHLFMKDKSWHGLYGCWYQAVEGWFQISLKISTVDPDCSNGGWYMTPDFDPSNIRALGVAFGTPEHDPKADFAYQGAVYIDQVEIVP